MWPEPLICSWQQALVTWAGAPGAPCGPQGGLVCHSVGEKREIKVGAFPSARCCIGDARGGRVEAWHECFWGVLCPALPLSEPRCCWPLHGPLVNTDTALAPFRRALRWRCSRSRSQAGLPSAGCSGGDALAPRPALAERGVCRLAAAAARDSLLNNTLEWNRKCFVTARWEEITIFSIGRAAFVRSVSLPMSPLLRELWPFVVWWHWRGRGRSPRLCRGSSSHRRPLSSVRNF